MIREEERARAAGYISGLNGAENLRLMQPPHLRFTYDAGRRDGEKCQPDAAKGG